MIRWVQYMSFGNTYALSSSIGSDLSKDAQILKNHINSNLDGWILIFEVGLQSSSLVGQLQRVSSNFPLIFTFSVRLPKK